MKYEHFQKYLLYKYYSSYIPVKFVPKSNYQNMSNKQLENYILKLKMLCNYSKKSYILREQFKLHINEDKRDVGHDIAINITKQYHNDILQFINKITAYLQTPKRKPNFNILKSESKQSENEQSENESDNIFNETEHETERILIKNKAVKIEKSDDEILDEIILKKQEMVDKMYLALYNKFTEYNISCHMSLLYMALQTLSLSTFDIIFNRLNDESRRILYDNILLIDKTEFVKLILHTRRTNLIHPDDNIENIIYCDVILKSETRINPLFMHKSMNIDMLSNILFLKLIYNITREEDREKFKEIIGDRQPKLTKNFKSMRNILDPTKTVGETIENNDTIYFFMDYNTF